MHEPGLHAVMPSFDEGATVVLEPPALSAAGVNTQFGDRLRRLRESQRLSVRRLARLVAVSPSYLSRIERSHVPPPSERTIARIARALAIEADELLAAAGRLPEDVASRLLRRPRLMAKLVRLADTLPDDAIEELCRVADNRT